MTPKLIAHRGDTANFPENTIEAFASAFEKGAFGVELDVQEKAGELIVVHNYMYDRTQTYPQLTEVLDRFAGQGELQIEIKSLDLGFLDPLKAVLQNYPNANIELTTSVFGIVHHIREAFQHTPVGIIFPAKEFEDWMIEEGFLTTKVMKLMQLFNANIAHLPREVVSVELVEALHADQSKVHSHIPKSAMPEQLKIYEAIKSLGVDQCTIDDIALVAATRIA